MEHDLDHYGPTADMSRDCRILQVHLDVVHSKLIVDIIFKTVFLTFKFAMVDLLFKMKTHSEVDFNRSVSAFDCYRK
jgi:hypothetical protein